MGFIEQQILKSNEWLESCSVLLGGLNFDGHSKNMISVSLSDLSIEHNKSINLLVQKHNDGSAFALIRLQFEAFVRSIWFYHCANDVDIKSFLNGGEPPKIQSMINDIEKIDGYLEKRLSLFKSKFWKDLNSFTHGGDFHVKSRISNRKIISNYPIDEVLKLIQLSTKISLFSATTISWVADNVNLGGELLKTYNSIFPDKIEQSESHA